MSNKIDAKDVELYLLKNTDFFLMEIVVFFQKKIN